MKHFLATRFNLTVPDWKTSKSGKLVLTDNWLENRFYLFENYCLPSVKNQTNQNFTWCVFFDANTSDFYKKKVKVIEENYSNFKPLFIDGIGSLHNSFKDFIVNNLKNNEYVITTRLDNDDLIHKDFIKTIQSLYQPIDKTVIDLRKGYSITLKEKYSEIRVYVGRFNPFISLVEEAKKIETVFAKMHLDWGDSKNVIIENNLKLWVELVHEENKLNHTKVHLQRTYVFNNRDFGLFYDLSFKEKKIEVISSNIKLKLHNNKKIFKQKLISFLK
ncbi:MAG: glycosyltransferase [Flavobacteriales bacterium]